MSNSPDPIVLAQMVRDARRFWSTEEGRAQWAAERACLGPACEQLFGGHSLELAMAPRLADMCPINHAMQWSPTRELAEHPATLVCTPDQLPLPDESLALVVIHHLLEVVDQPHHVLQEAARVTADDGRLFIFGWSPRGFSGLSRLIPNRRRWDSVLGYGCIMSDGANCYIYCSQQLRKGGQTSMVTLGGVFIH